MRLFVKLREDNHRLRITLEEDNQRLKVVLDEDNQRLDVSFKHFQEVFADPPEYYRGGYHVIPKVEEQVVATAQKFLQEDMVVRAIPFYDTHNASGGTTVYIGDLIE